MIDHLGTTGVCPECGKAFDLKDSTTYTLRLPLVRWRFWLPGFVAALVACVALEVVLIRFFGFTWSTVLCVTLAGGVLLGYGTRASKGTTLVLFAVVFTGSVVLAMFSGGIVGVFCGLVFSAIAFGPILVGMLIGTTLRSVLKASNFRYRDYLPLFIIIVPVICAFLEGRHDHLSPVTLTTSTTIHAHAKDAWNSIQFYEQVKHAPPWLLRLTPSFRPMYTNGHSEKVGDIKVCVYERGRLVKQITEVIPGKRLAFRVIEQTKIENSSVRLIGGSFDLSPSADGKDTVVTLTTQYQPLLAPRFTFLPAEELAVHELHGHVLLGMKTDAEQCHQKP